MKKKSVLLAMFLSFIIPGVGNIYAGKTGLGIFFLILWFISLVVTFTGIFAIIGIPVWILLFIISIITAGVAASSFNKQFGGPR